MVLSTISNAQISTSEVKIEDISGTLIKDDLKVENTIESSKLTTKYADNLHYGYIEFRREDDARGGYIGWGNGSDRLFFRLENSANLEFQGGDHNIILDAGKDFFVKNASRDDLFRVDSWGTIYSLSSTNNAHSYLRSPWESGRYGNIAIWGHDQGGWSGINFRDTEQDMLIKDNQVGWHKEGKGWTFSVINDNAKHYVNLRQDGGGSNKQPFNFSDSWLRLNQYYDGSSYQTGGFTNGVYTPSFFRGDGGFEFRFGNDRIFSSEGSSIAFRRYTNEGWANGLIYLGYSGGNLGGFQAYGTGDNLNYYFIGIDYLNPEFKFEPNGNLTANNFIQSSDSRLKSDIQKLNNQLVYQNLTGLDLYSFNFKGQKVNQKNLGVIAQEVQKNFPDLVNQNEEGYLSVNYPNLAVLSIAGIKELKKENTKLKEELVAIKEELSELRKLINRKQ